jgi:hypothetical protein
MSDIRFQQLKLKIWAKTDEEVATMLNPYEDKYAPIRKLKSSSAHYIHIMKYLFFLYDPGTDLNREFVRLEDRKTEAAKLSGLNKILDSYVNQIYDCTHPATLDVIQTLLTEVFHDRKYREWQTLQNELDEYTSARWEKATPKRRKSRKKDESLEEVTGTHDKTSMEILNLKSKLRDECAKINATLDQLEQAIFGDHTDIKDIAYKSRFMNPESFSRAAKQAV